jgi:hypothetical protein
MIKSQLQGWAALVVLALAVKSGANGAVASPTPAVSSSQREAVSPGGESAHLGDLRKKAVQRKRRIIFNNDGDDAITPRKGDSSILDQFLSQRAAPLVGSPVGTISYCSIRCFGSVLHRTEVAENLSTHLGGHYPDSLLSHLLAQGTDPLEAMVQFGHRNNMEVFCSMRMNDTHDATNPALRPVLKSEHPEYLFGPPGKRPPYGQWSAVDYGQAEVRERAVRYIKEVCTNYDIDGVELDFFRHPVLFKIHAHNGKVGDAEREMLTDMVRKIRAVAYSAGERRGRPILIAIRVPDSVGFCRGIGIDLARWLREGLTDLLVTGGYFRLNPFEHSVALGHQYGIPVYPSLDAPVALLDPAVPEREISLTENFPRLTASEARPMDLRRSSPESWRGRAAVALKARADGIYLFNVFSPSRSMLKEIGDPVSLAGTNKLYFVNWRGTRQPPTAFLSGGGSFYHERPLNPHFPLEIGTAPLTVSIPIGDESPPSKGARQPNVTAELWIQPASMIGAVEVRYNGQTLRRGQTVGDRINFAIEPGLTKSGTNVFVLQKSSGASAKAFLKDIVLHVTHAGGSISRVLPD